MLLDASSTARKTCSARACARSRSRRSASCSALEQALAARRRAARRRGRARRHRGRHAARSKRALDGDDHDEIHRAHRRARPRLARPSRAGAWTAASRKALAGRTLGRRRSARPRTRAASSRTWAARGGLTDAEGSLHQARSSKSRSPDGTTILEAAKQGGRARGRRCGGVCACSTCHVYVTKGFDYLSEIEDEEFDILDKAFDVRSDLAPRLPGEDRTATSRSRSATRASRRSCDEHPNEKAEALALRRLSLATRLSLLAPKCRPRATFGGRCPEWGHGRLAQLDRASASGAEGHRFESCTARRSNQRGS